MELELEITPVLILAEMEMEMEEMVTVTTIRRNQQSLSVVSDFLLIHGQIQLSVKFKLVHPYYCTCGHSYFHRLSKNSYYLY